MSIMIASDYTIDFLTFNTFGNRPKVDAESSSVHGCDLNDGLVLPGGGEMGTETGAGGNRLNFQRFAGFDPMFTGTFRPIVVPLRFSIGRDVPSPR
jgi:hypothetical protein